jgi:hypothetical protein
MISTLHKVKFLSSKKIQTNVEQSSIYENIEKKDFLILILIINKIQLQT